jgi:transcriptional regulator with XRE-family HTH domain
MGTRKLGVRRTMTPNQIVALNVAKARALRGWTQEQAAEELAPYLGAKLSTASFSALERSAWKVDRIKQFSADELLALSRAFDLPIGYFFVPLPPASDAALHAPGAGMKGLDPIVIVDAILGTPDNLRY